MPEPRTRLILNDGTVINDGRCGYADARLWCWIMGYTMSEAAGIFFDASKTERIVYEFGEMTSEYDGFTECVSLNINEDGQVSVCLKRGGVNV